MIILYWVFSFSLFFALSIVLGWYYAKSRRLEKENRQLFANVIFNPQDYKHLVKDLLEKD